ncbi:MAG: aldo/keto reductase [Candidatus Heimdallarchaeota archaeon]|nr:aldo/keto reductase [Candidatus Heimdallarchaeota archaeon]
MDYRKLGNTGIKISELVLGTMQFGWRTNEKESFEIMDRAVELGINTLDTADIYSKWTEESYAGKTEEIIGRWMNERGNRNDLVLATKLFGEMSENINDRGLSRKHIHQALKGSLTRLQTEWVDIYFTHTFDQETPVEETLRTFTSLIEQGKIHYIGASNTPAWRIMRALWVSDKNDLERYEVLEPVYNIARRHTYEQEIEPIVNEFKLGVTSYSPIGGGFLTGKYQDKKSDSPRFESVKRRYFKERNFETVKIMQKIAEEKEITMPQLAIAWVLHQESITAPIIGANSVKQLEENVKAIEVKLTEDELKRLNEVSDWKELDEQSR